MSPAARAARRGQAGFTLLELGAALTLLALLLAIAAPPLRRLADGATVRAAAADVATALVAARELAVAEARPVGVHLRPGDGSLLVVAAGDTVRRVRAWPPRATPPPSAPSGSGSARRTSASW